MMKRKMRVLQVMSILLFLSFLSTSAVAGVRMGFKFYGGTIYLGGGDLNRGTEGLADALKRLVTEVVLPTATTTDTYLPVHWGIDAGGDLILEFTPSFGIALGAGYVRSSRSCPFAYTHTAPLSSLSTNSDARADAVRFSLQFNYVLPTTSGIFVVFHAGPELYLAGIRSRGYLEVNGLTLVDFDTEADGQGLGFQAGLGLEYGLSDHLGLFMDALGRYANFAGFEGKTNLLFGLPFSPVQGTLYYYDRVDPISGSETLIRCSPTAPSGPEYHNVREAKIDLSGFSLRLGLVIRLGPRD